MKTLSHHLIVLVFLALSSFAFIFAIAPVAHALRNKNADVTCGCYWVGDCAVPYCNYTSGCTKSGKSDGSCLVPVGGVSGEKLPTFARAINPKRNGFLVQA
jgi:hypothetical protein